MSLTSFRYFSLLVVLPAIYLYFACKGHYEWAHVKQGDSLIDYEYKYSSSKYDLSSIAVPLKSSIDEAVIHNWLLRDRESQADKLPLVIMSHGLGGQKDMGLLPYAERFADAGFAVLLIDYRYFGLSTNSDKTNFRNLIDPWNHVADIQTVLDAVVKDKVLGSTVDETRIVLWGTSFAGGHMLRIAHNNQIPNIKAVVSQVPHLDGKAASLRALKSRGVVGFLRVMTLAVGDILCTQLNKLAAMAGVHLNLPSVYVKIVGVAGESAYMIIEREELAQYYAKHPTHYLGGWRNRAPARTLAYMSAYSPIQDVPHVKVPVLFVTATRDALCPAESVRDAAKLAPRGQLLELNTTHFDLYTGANFDHICAEMVKFAVAHAQQ
jgi:pimeloyl-ACP methyl ester carboxylesterase